MASQRWKGNAAAVADVWTITITADDATTTYKVTINSKVVSTLGSGSGTTPTATALAAALAASTIPEFLEATWTSNSAVVTGTMKTAGIPMTPSSSVSGGTGTIGAATNATVATGPNYWNNAANWSTGSVPVNADDVYIENSAVSIQYGLAQSGVTLNSLNVSQTFTGDIGLPETNKTATAYLEYRAQYLAIGATTVAVGDPGQGQGTGSGRIKIDNGSVQTTVRVNNTGAPAEAGLESMLWKGTHASNVVHVNKGSFAACGYGGEVATIATLNVGFVASASGDAVVRCGAGISLTTANVLAGTVVIGAGLTTVNQKSGVVTVQAGNITTWTADSGTAIYTGTGTISTLNVGGGAAADFSHDMRARTVSACNLYAGAALLDPQGTLQSGFAFVTVRCSIADVTVLNGLNRTYTVT